MECDGIIIMIAITTRSRLDNWIRLCLYLPIVDDPFKKYKKCNRGNDCDCVSHVYSIPTQQNVSYSFVAVRESQLTTSGTQTQATRSASENESANIHTYYGVIQCSS